MLLLRQILTDSNWHRPFSWHLQLQYILAHVDIFKMHGAGSYVLKLLSVVAARDSHEDVQLRGYSLSVK